ncbi:MAG: hypothetical protein ACREPZ_06155, partial [Rhodanobacteraceae bacterium]
SNMIEGALGHKDSMGNNARMYSGLFDGDETATLPLAPGRLGYVHVVKGSATVNGHAVSAGDALLYADEDAVRVERGTGAELLVFDLPQMQ